MKKYCQLFIILLDLSLTNIFYSQDCADSNNIYFFIYEGRKYEIVKENKSWIDAANCAAERGGILAEIDSQDEQDSIYYHLQNANIINSNTVAPDGGGASYVWLGGNDGAEEGIWVWDGDNDGEGRQFWEGTASGNPVDSLYSNWGNEPHNWNEQDALGIALTDWPLGSAGQWNDIDHNNSLYYIIEYEYLEGKSLIYVPDDIETISEAILAANDGDTIIVRDGIYEEDILVDRSLTILSENPLGAQIGDTTALLGRISIGNTEIISDVIIDGFKLIGQNSTGIMIGDFVNDLYVANCRIKNCHISNYEFGISVNSTSTNCVIDSNTIIGVKKRGLSYSGAGINTVSNNTFENNGYQGIVVFPYSRGTLLIKNNDIVNNQRAGLEIQADSVTVEGNRIDSNNYEGILIREDIGGIVYIKNNIITNNIWSGILVAENSEAEVDSNDVSENKENGISLFGSAIISSNYFVENVKDGINVGMSGNASIEDNLIESNEVGVKSAVDAEYVTLADNNITGNSSGIIAGSPMKIRNNVIEENIAIGISIFNSAVDIGQDSDEDPGMNVIRNNIDWNIDNNTDGNISAYRNYWGFTKANEIDSTLYDDDEDNLRGEVYFEPFLVDDPTSVVELNEDADIPTEYALFQNYPNPFNPSTTISYRIPNRLRRLTNDGVNSESAIVNLVIYDVLGREVATLVDEKQSPGNHEVQFSTKISSHYSGVTYDLRSGIYFYRLRVGNSFVETKKMILVK